jgi:hypothetical protein
MIADFRTEINEGPLEYEARVLNKYCSCVHYVVSISFMNHESSKSFGISVAFPIHDGNEFLFTFQEPFKDKRKLFYLKTRMVPRSKHLANSVIKPISECELYRANSLFALR